MHPNCRKMTKYTKRIFNPYRVSHLVHSFHWLISISVRSCLNHLCSKERIFIDFVCCGKHAIKVNFEAVNYLNLTLSVSLKDQSSICSFVVLKLNIFVYFVVSLISCFFPLLFVIILQTFRNLYFNDTFSQLQNTVQLYYLLVWFLKQIFN